VKNKEKKKLPLALKIAAGAGVAVGAAALFAVRAFTSPSGAESVSDESDTEITDDECEDYPDYIRRKKEYTGYVPVGCSACGGPYPQCKMGCPVFDDE